MSEGEEENLGCFNLTEKFGEQDRPVELCVCNQDLCDGVNIESLAAQQMPGTSLATLLTVVMLIG